MVFRAKDPRTAPILDGLVWLVFYYPDHDEELQFRPVVYFKKIPPDSHPVRTSQLDLSKAGHAHARQACASAESGGLSAGGWGRMRKSKEDRSS